MEQRVIKTLELWCKNSPALFTSPPNFENRSIDDAICDHMVPSQYRKRIKGYVSSFNKGRFSDFKIWHGGILYSVEAMKWIHECVAFQLEHMEGELTLDPTEIVPIFSSYWRRANDNMTVEDCRKADKSPDTKWSNSAQKHISTAQRVVELHARNQGKTAAYAERYGCRTPSMKIPYGAVAQDVIKNPCSEIKTYNYATIKTSDMDYSNTLINTGKTKMENITDDAKSSLKVAADLAKGRTALATVHGIITKLIPMKFGYFARLMGKDKAVMDSPYTKLAGAVVAHAVALQFDNYKVQAVTKLAQDASFAEVAGLIPIEDFVSKLAELAGDKITSKE